MKHVAIYTNNSSNKEEILAILQTSALIGNIEYLQGELFSDITINKYLSSEQKHDKFELTANSKKRLKHYSDGEQKKLLFEYILSKNPDYIIIDNVFDNLDIDTQTRWKERINSVQKKIIFIQLSSRKTDFFPFISNRYYYNNKTFLPLDEKKEQSPESKVSPEVSLSDVKTDEEIVLIRFNKVSISYLEKKILHNISWQIKSNSFWHLVGPNGSGKTTILSCLTGENPKAYGKDVTLFGRKKGTGESIWDIKRQIGYFSSVLTQGFSKSNTALEMIISGFYDSIGLYNKVNATEIKLANNWLQTIELSHDKDTPFLDLSLVNQRLVMLGRSIIKSPKLLILDEPTVGLDDENTRLFSDIINNLSTENKMAIIFVSHRSDTGLKPKQVFELTPTREGSIGTVKQPIS